MSSIPIDLDGVDRISNLPESILHHILSFLPTKNAVATSLVSRRWEFLWKNMHKLIFCDDFRLDHLPEEKKKFAHFVNNMLILLNKQRIDEFSLDLYRYTEHYDVCTWIAAAVAKEIKVLKFSVLTYHLVYFSMPRSLFTCTTLEVLILVYSVFVKVPRVVCLPNLKTLHLDSVIYHSEECVCNLISGCLSLETLFINRDSFDTVLTFIISSPTLRKLSFTFISAYKSIELNYKLEINAPALKFLDLDDRISRDFSVESLCSVEEANISLLIDESSSGFDYDHYSKAVAKLIQGLNSNVKNLSLVGNTLKALSHVGATTPNFMELSRLTVKACHFNLLINLLKGSDKLEFLTMSHITYWSILEKVPIWLFSSLKTMSIFEFEGLAHELAMVAYVLKNGKALRTMIIKVPSHVDLKASYELLQKVSNFPRGSEECQITFS